MRILATIAVLLSMPGLLFASQADLIARAASAEDIPQEEWYAMVAGQTVTYRIDSQIWAQETYDPKTNRVYIALADGKCMEGIWVHIDNAFCFAWEDNRMVCFRHARSDDEILIIPVEDGQIAGAIQVVESIDDSGLPCGPELVS